MQFIRVHSSTSNTFRVTLRHSTTGQGLTGLTEASAGLIIGTIADNEATTTRYRASSSEIETIATLGTFSAPSASKCRFKEVDATNHPGEYEIQLADARFAVASAKQLTVTISGATNLLAKKIIIQLSSVNLDNAVNAGLSAIPDAAHSTSGGLPTVGTGTGQISLTSGAILLPTIPTDWITANGIAASAVSEIQSGLALVSSLPTNFSSLGINASGHISRVTLTDTLTTYTGNTPQTGDNYTRLGAPAGASVSADIAAIKALLPTGAPSTGPGLPTLNDVEDLITAAENALPTEIWAHGTRTLTALGFTLGSSNFGTDWLTATGLAASAVAEIQSGLSTLDAAGVRTAIGLASANLDTQLDALPTAAENATALLATAIETGVSLQQSIRAIAAAAAGKREGSGTSNEKFYAIGNPATLRITTNADGAGDGTPSLSL